MSAKYIGLFVLKCSVALVMSMNCTVQAAESIRVVMARVSGDPFYKTLECAARTEAIKRGVKLEIVGMANYDVAEQTRVLNAIIATRPDVIITAPVDPVGVIPIFRTVQSQGIGMVTFDTTLSDTKAVAAQIVVDNREQGRLAADSLAKSIGNKGKVFVLSDMPGMTTTDEEQKGFEEQIKKYPDIKYLGTEYHNNDQNKAVATINAVMTRSPDLAGLFTTNTFGSQAASTAMRQTGRIGKVKIIAYDTTEEILDGLKQGVFAGVIAYEARAEGVLAIDAAARLAMKQPVEKIRTVKSMVLTSENLEKFGPEFVYVNSCQ